jgi:hypothetical protein
MLAGSQVYGFLGTKEMAPNGKYQVVIKDRIDLPNANCIVTIHNLGHENKDMSPAVLNPEYSRRYHA